MIGNVTVEREYFFVEEVAKMTGFSEQAVRRLAREGILPATRLSRKYIFNKAELRDSLATSRTGKGLDDTDKMDTVHPVETGAVKGGTREYN